MQSPPPPPPIAHDSSSYRAQQPPYSSSSPSTPLSPSAPEGVGSPGSSSSGIKSPSSSTAPSSGGSTNPLIDLIESEKRYIEELGAVIRKVAGAWSRANFPPPLLDSMFRAIEGVYKINRAFGAKLKEIGPNPSSPKALGDLLMRWVDDMEPAYTRYSKTYLADFNSWSPVASNVNLPRILNDVTAQLSQPPTNSPTGQWTLDDLFLLPCLRLKYYKKLYARLLKNTQPGRSDHTLLVGANNRLTTLMETLRERLTMTVGDEARMAQDMAHGAAAGGSGRSSAAPAGAASVPTEAARGSGGSLPPSVRGSLASSADGSRTSENPSIFSSSGGGLRDSNESATTSFGSTPPLPLAQIVSSPGGGRELPPVLGPEVAETSPPAPYSALSPGAPPQEPLGGPSQTLLDIERRLDPERVMDLFTMKPRQVRLQIAPPALPFQRKIRRSVDVEIFFTPTSTGEKINHPRGFIFILSDLFLICERMEPGERAQKVAEADGAQGPDLWLCYPPLAGKHLSVSPGPTDNHIEVVVMRKETFMLRVEDRRMQQSVIADFKDCIDFATKMQLAVQTALPKAPSPPSAQQPGMVGSNFGMTSPMSGAPSFSGGPRPGPGPGGFMPLSNSSGPTDPRTNPHGGAFMPMSANSSGGRQSERAFSQGSNISNGSGGGGSTTGAGSPQPHQQPPHQQMATMALDGSVGQPRAISPNMPPPRGASVGALQPGQVANGGMGGGPPRGASLGRPPQQGIGGPPGGGSPGSGQQFPPFPPQSRAGGLPTPPGPQQQQQQHSALPPLPSPIGSGRQPLSPISDKASIIRSQSGNSSRSQPSIYSNFEEPPPLPPARDHLPAIPGQHQMHQSHYIGGPNGQQAFRPPPGPGGGYPPRGGIQSASASPNLDNHSLPGGPGFQPAFRSRSAEPTTPTLPSLPPSKAFDLTKSMPSLDGYPAPGQGDEEGPSEEPEEAIDPTASDPTTLSGPAVISAAMKCKVFLKRDHAQWKALGSARLKLYHQQSGNVKQVVVESEKGKMLISTIVLVDGVERVGRTGVAIEISDAGRRTGVVYMIQLRNETSAAGLFETLLAGTNRLK